MRHVDVINYFSLTSYSENCPGIIGYELVFTDRPAGRLEYVTISITISTVLSCSRITVLDRKYYGQV